MSSNEYTAPAPPSAKAQRRAENVHILDTILGVPGVVGLDGGWRGWFNRGAGLRINRSKRGIRIRVRLRLAGGFPAVEVAANIRAALADSGLPINRVDVFFTRVNLPKGWTV